MTAKGLLLKNVSLPTGMEILPESDRTADLYIREGRIHSWSTGAEAKQPPAADFETRDCTGYCIFPGLIDGHVHLDKTIWGDAWVPSRLPLSPVLADLIENEKRMRVERSHDPRIYAPRLLKHMNARGTTAVRSHIDVDPTTKLTGVRALLEVREAFKNRMDIELVAFPQSGILMAEGVENLLDEALKMGVDAIGGLDPAAFDGDPARHLDVVFRLAAKHGVKVDIHLHEPGVLGAFSIKAIAKRTKEYGLEGRVTLSHAFALGGVSPEVFAELLSLLVESRIAVVTSAPGAADFAPHAPLLQAGITYALGSDNIRDYWSPFGDGDMLDRVRQLALRRKLRHDSLIEQAFTMATTEGAKLLGLTDYGLHPGCRADCVLVKASGIAEAVVSCPQKRIVIKNGRVIAGEWGGTEDR